MQLMTTLLDREDYRTFLARQKVKLHLADVDGKWSCIGNPSSLKVIANHIIHPNTDNANVLVRMNVLLA